MTASAVSSELIKIRFHCLRWPGKFPCLMTIPARAPDELLIAATSRPIENYGSVWSIGTAIRAHFISHVYTVKKVFKGNNIFVHKFNNFILKFYISILLIEK